VYDYIIPVIMLLSITINTFLVNADRRVKLMKPCLEQVGISGMWGEHRLE